MLLCCLLKRCLDLGFHFSGFLRKRPTRTCELFFLPPRWTIGGPANIAKLPAPEAAHSTNTGRRAPRKVSAFIQTADRANPGSLGALRKELRRRGQPSEAWKSQCNCHPGALIASGPRSFQHLLRQAPITKSTSMPASRRRLTTALACRPTAPHRRRRYWGLHPDERPVVVAIAEVRRGYRVHQNRPWRSGRPCCRRQGRNTAK
jgi:hypothetical protein